MKEDYNVLESNKSWQKENNYDLDTMLEEVSIQDVEEGELIGWFAVVDCDVGGTVIYVGVVAGVIIVI